MEQHNKIEITPAILPAKREVSLYSKPEKMAYKIKATDELGRPVMIDVKLEAPIVEKKIIEKKTNIEWSEKKRTNFYSLQDFVE